MSLPTQEEWAEAVRGARYALLETGSVQEYDYLSDCARCVECRCVIPDTADPVHESDCKRRALMDTLSSLLTRAEQGGV